MFIKYLQCCEAIRLFKVDSGNTRKISKICSKFPVSFMLTLNRFHTLFWCFHCWLWTNKCRLGEIPEHDRYYENARTYPRAYFMSIKNESLDMNNIPCWTKERVNILSPTRVILIFSKYRLIRWIISTN